MPGTACRAAPYRDCVAALIDGSVGLIFVHGYCVAGGIDLALACDMIIAAADARIGFPPARSQRPCRRTGSMQRRST